MKAYAIKDPNRYYLLNTIGSCESESIFEFQTHYTKKDISWKNYESKGYRCVPVEITEIKK